MLSNELQLNHITKAFFAAINANLLLVNSSFLIMWDSETKQGGEKKN